MMACSGRLRLGSLVMEDTVHVRINADQVCGVDVLQPSRDVARFGVKSDSLLQGWEVCGRMEFRKVAL